MAPATASATLRSLLARTDLSLRLISPAAQLAGGALEADVPGVHSSDLADPTPFLTEGLLLLTTGRQFAGWADDDPGYLAYIARLVDSGIAGLGFGTEVLRDGIPPGLEAACRQHRMPLFEVPYETPFIAVVRANAEAVAARRFARRTWALEAQRALAIAALEADGIPAILGELARQVHGWAALFDASGALVREHPAGLLDRPSRAAVAARAGDLLRRGAPAAAGLAATTPADATLDVTVQTLGRGGHLRGALALGAGDLDHAARGVLTSAVGMVGLAIEQRHALTRARTRLRAGLLRALLAGERDLAASVAGEVWGPLPAAPVTVSVIAGAGGELSRVADLLERHDGAVFFGSLPSDVPAPPARRDARGPHEGGSRGPTRHPGAADVGGVTRDAGAVGAGASGTGRGPRAGGAGAARTGGSSRGTARTSAVPGGATDASLDSGLVLIASENDGTLPRQIAAAHAVRIGVSRPASDTELAVALDQALAAVAAAGSRASLTRGGEPGASSGEGPADAVGAAAAASSGIVVTFGEVAAADLLGAAGPHERSVAAARLAPLAEYDAAHGTALVPTLAAWFAADCGNEHAADALGVHRHTVRARLAHIERLLDRDLGSFAVRAELWAALRIAG